MNCDFCENNSIKERLITENELAKAFPTSQPIVPGHTLIISKRCVPKFEDLTTKEKDAIFDLIKKIKMALTKTFNCTEFNHAWNEGSTAGQTVPHFHLHIIPRKEDDNGIHKYEPRKFLYRPSSRNNSPEEELKNVAQEIKKNL